MIWRDAYLDNQILTADPLELVRMMYQAAIDSIGDARRHLAAGEIASRAKAIIRAQAIICELNASLDRGAGEISVNLAGLYHYMRRRLTEANLQQKDAPLAEVEGLLITLYDAWRHASAPQPEQVGAVFAAGRDWGGSSAGGDAHTWSA